MQNQIPSVLFALDRIFEPRKVETTEPVLHTWCGLCGEDLTYTSAGGICGRCAKFKYEEEN